jgi:hypothetical protein
MLSFAKGWINVALRAKMPTSHFGYIYRNKSQWCSDLPSSRGCRHSNVISNCNGFPKGAGLSSTVWMFVIVVGSNAKRWVRKMWKSLLQPVLIGIIPILHHHLGLNEINIMTEFLTILDIVTRDMMSYCRWSCRWARDEDIVVVFDIIDCGIWNMWFRSIWCLVQESDLSRFDFTGR